MNRAVAVIRALILFVAVISILIPPFGATTTAAERCRAEWTWVGQMPRLTGSTPTNWFNVFGIGFDQSQPALLTFDLPVIPYSIDNPMSSQPATTEFTMPPGYTTSYFKWTFRAENVGVERINVTIAGKGCRASTVVTVRMPDSAIAAHEPTTPISPIVPVALFVSFVTALLASLRWLSAVRR